MKHWMLVAAAVLALAGCQKSSSPNEDVAQAREDLERTARERGEQLHETVESAQRDVGEEARNAERDIDAKRKELAEKRADANEQTGSLSGVVASAGDDSVTIRSADGTQTALQVNDDTQLFVDDRPVEPDTLQPGTEVRASWHVEGDQKVLERLDADASDRANDAGER